MSEGGEVREFRVTNASLERSSKGRTRKQEGGSAPVETVGQVAQAMTGAADAAAKAYQGTLQGQTPMSSAGTMTSQIIRPDAMGVDPEVPKGPMVGGKASARVELKAPKNRTRVALRAPRKLRSIVGTGGAHKTHKARKIRLAVKGLASKVKKARKTAKAVAKMSIDTIRSSLVKAGVLKGGSKAPDSMLRKMYADLKTTSNGL